MTMIRTAVIDCPDIKTCPAKIEDTEDTSAAYVVGTCVTDPAALDRLAGRMGVGSGVVRTPRSLWADISGPDRWEGAEDPAGAYVVGETVTDPAMRAQLADYVGPGEDVVRVSRERWDR